MVHKPAPATLEELVEVAHAGILELVEVLRQDPPTPGVTDDVRKDLARELAIEPLCLRDAADVRPGIDVGSRLDRLLADGEHLASRFLADGPLPGDLLDAVAEHLRAAMDLALDLSAAAGDDTALLAMAYGRSRSTLIYQL